MNAPELSRPEKLALEIITIAGGVVSIAGLIIALFTVLCFKYGYNMYTNTKYVILISIIINI